MSKLRFCRFCRAVGIRTILVIADYEHRIRTTHHCPVCGEVLAVIWTKKKKEG